jgi:hypothetical protein
MVYNTEASNLDPILPGVTCVPSIQPYTPMFLKMKVSPLENTNRKKAFLSHTNSVLKGKQCADTPACNLDGIVPGDTCVSSIQQYRPIFHKLNDSPTCNHLLVRSIPLKLKLISRRGTMSKTLKLLTSMLFFQH